MSGIFNGPPRGGTRGGRLQIYLNCEKPSSEFRPIVQARTNSTGTTSSQIKTESSISDIV